MWRAFVPAVLGICLALGSTVPAVAQRTAGSTVPPPAPRPQPVSVVVASVPGLVFIGSIPVLVTRQVIVVRGGAAVAVTIADGLFFVNGVPVAVMSPTTQVVVVGAQDAGSSAD